jgi:sodium transport system permease protein
MASNLVAALRIARKEIRESLRDRNLLINVVLVPLFLYPALGFGAFQVFQIIRGIAEQKATRVFVGPGVPPALVERLESREELLVVESPPELSDPADDPSIARTFRDHRQRARVSDEPSADLLLLWHPQLAASGDSASVYFDRSVDRSTEAREIVLEELAAWERERSLVILQELDLTATDYDLWALALQDSASAAERGNELLSRILPLVLLLMLGIGTFYSTLDTVVGERERGTLETTLTVPLARDAILLGKLLYVVAASLVALLLNLASMTIFLGFIIELVDLGREMQIEINPLAVVLIVITAVPTACLIAAIMIVVAIPARSYREGQSMLTPIYLLLLAPALIGVTLEGTFGVGEAVVPVLNAVALFKSALHGELAPLPVAVTLVVLVFLAVVALKLAAHLSRREAVYFDPQLTLHRLLSRERSKRS